MDESSPFETQVIGETAVVACPGGFVRENIDTLVTALQKIKIETGPGAIRCVALHFTKDAKADVASVKKLAQPLTSFKKAEIRVVFIDTPASVLKLLKSQGLDGLFQFLNRSILKTNSSAAIEDSGSHAHPKPTTLNAEHLAPLISATLKVFKTLADLNLVPSLSDITNNTAQKKYEIAGMTSFTLDGAAGDIALCLSSQVFLYTTSKMFKREVTTIDHGLTSCAAELLSNIMGTARTELSQKTHNLTLEIPKAVYPITDSNPISSKPGAGLLFETEHGSLSLKIWLRQ